MHHPREAVIDGVQFVLIREDLLEEVKDLLGDLKTSPTFNELPRFKAGICALIEALGVL
jgi:hypothetical protein